MDKKKSLKELRKGAKDFVVAGLLFLLIITLIGRWCARDLQRWYQRKFEECVRACNDFNLTIKEFSVAQFTEYTRYLCTCSGNVPIDLDNYWQMKHNGDASG